MCAPKLKYMITDGVDDVVTAYSDSIYLDEDLRINIDTSVGMTFTGYIRGYFDDADTDLYSYNHFACEDKNEHVHLPLNIIVCGEETIETTADTDTIVIVY